MRTDHLPIYSRNPHMLMAIFKEIQLHYYLLLHFTYITISINHVAITDNACSLTYMCIYIYLQGVSVFVILILGVIVGNVVLLNTLLVI